MAYIKSILRQTSVGFLAMLLVCSLTTVILEAVSEVAPDTSAVDLVQNGQFDDQLKMDTSEGTSKPQVWEQWIPKEYASTAHQIGVSEDGVLRISSTDPFKTVVKQTISVQGGRTYDLRYDIQAQNVTKGAAFVRLLVYRDKERLGVFDTGFKLQSNHDWQTQSHAFQAPNEATHIVLELHYDRVIGEVAFDNIHFQTLPSEQLSDSEGQAQTPNEASPQIAPSEEMPSLIRNGSFSTTLEQSGEWTGPTAEGWELWIDQAFHPKDYTIATTPEGVLSFMNTTQPLRAVVRQTVSVSDAMAYRLSYRLATDQMTGIARVRIIEKSKGKQKNLWYGPANVSGTTSWQSYEKTYVPLRGVDEVVVELFYDKGTGTVQFDEIQLVATGALDRQQSPDAVLPESEIIMVQDKPYIPQLWQARYEVVNTAVAQFENGLLVPKALGTTEVRIYHGVTQELLATVPLHVKEPQQYQRSAIEKWNDVIAGNRLYDAQNVTMATQNTKLDAEAEAILTGFETAEDRRYLWADAADYEISANLTKTYRKLELLAKQITQPHSRFYKDERALRTVKNALAWLHVNVYNKDKDIVGNWWDYEIGTPRALNNTLSLLHEYITIDEMQHYTDVIDKFVPDPTRFRYTTDPFVAVGGNLIDMGRVKIIESLLRNDATMQQSATAALAQAFHNVSRGEGFYEDGSHIAHTNVAYNGGYGSVFIDGLSQLIPIVQESSYAYSQEQMSVVYQWIDRAFLPMLYRGELMDLTRGRSVSREKQESHVAAVELFRGILRIADASELNTKRKLQQAVKTSVLQDDYYDVFRNLHSYRDIYLMQEVLNNEDIAPVESQDSLRIYHQMDKVVYRNAQHHFAWALSLHSSRTLNYEYMNQEHARGWYTADGMNYLYNHDGAHYSDHYWPTVAANRLPGTTVVDEPREAGEGQVTMASSFVGGAKADERTAAIGMDFYNWNQQLRAKKAWFVLGNKVVHLGSDIHNTSGLPAVTTIENRKEGTNQYQVFIDGQPMTANQQHVAAARSLFLESSQPNRNIGYVFINPLDLQVQRETREGSWRQINGSGSQDTVHNQYISAVHVHSEAIDTAGYAYVLLPNQSREAVDAFAQKPSVHVLVNDANHQVVFDAEQNIWGVVKYQDTPYQVNEFIQLKHAGMYLIRQTDTGYMIAMHHPTVSDIEPLQAIDTIGVVTNTQKATAENATHYWTINLSERKPMPQDGWSWETDHWVYYKQGIAQTGWFQDSNAWYFADAEGVMQTGWQHINGQWYYLHSGGQMATGWQHINGQWYYLHSGGQMATGWQYINGQWYYLHSGGQMAIGWQHINGQWYYLHSGGQMATGWQQINGQWYYLATNGAMVVGVQFIDHRMYRFNAQGVWIP